MVKNYCPKRGDIVLVNFSPHIGKEQSGIRPALTISPQKYNEKVGLRLFCPITSIIKNYPFEVLLPDYLKTKGVILTDHIKNFDWTERKAIFLEKIPPNILENVIEKLTSLIK